MLGDDLTPEIIAYAVPPLAADGTRCLPSVMRIRRIGTTFFVEQLRMHRDDAGVAHEDWTGIAMAKPTQKEPNARLEAFAWMQDAHRQFVETTKS